jgi:hypothetical protein
MGQRFLCVPPGLTFKSVFYRTFYVVCMILGVISLSIINRLVFMMETRYVFFGVGTYF